MFEMTAGRNSPCDAAGLLALLVWSAKERLWVDDPGSAQADSKISQRVEWSEKNGALVPGLLRKHHKHCGWLGNRIEKFRVDRRLWFIPDGPQLFLCRPLPHRSTRFVIKTPMGTLKERNDTPYALPLNILWWYIAEIIDHP